MSSWTETSFVFVDTYMHSQISKCLIIVFPVTSYQGRRLLPSGSSLQSRKVKLLFLPALLLFLLKVYLPGFSITVRYFQGLSSARRTSVHGMSKPLHGSGIMAMIVLMMTEIFPSLKPRWQMVSNFSFLICGLQSLFGCKFSNCFELFPTKYLLQL